MRGPREPISRTTVSRETKTGRHTPPSRTTRLERTLSEDTPIVSPGAHEPVAEPRSNPTRSMGRAGE